jgi:hypothetical protein
MVAARKLVSPARDGSLVRLTARGRVAPATKRVQAQINPGRLSYEVFETNHRRKATLT